MGPLTGWIGSKVGLLHLILPQGNLVYRASPHLTSVFHFQYFTSKYVLIYNASVRSCHHITCPSLSKVQFFARSISCLSHVTRDTSFLVVISCVNIQSRFHNRWDASATTKAELAPSLKVVSSNPSGIHWSHNKFVIMVTQNRVNQTFLLDCSYIIINIFITEFWTEIGCIDCGYIVWLFFTLYFTCFADISVVASPESQHVSIPSQWSWHLFASKTQKIHMAISRLRRQQCILSIPGRVEGYLSFTTGIFLMCVT